MVGEEGGIISFGMIFSSFHRKVFFISNHVSLISFELSLLEHDNKDVLLCLILKCCDW